MTKVRASRTSHKNLAQIENPNDPLVFAATGKIAIVFPIKMRAEVCGTNWATYRRP
jgi:hypothetical protein